MSIDDQSKRLMAAIVEFAALLRRGEPDEESRLALGRIMKRHGLEQRHASALLTIALDGPLSVTELANRRHVTAKTASLIAIELEQAGLVSRREDPHDRRRTIVSIAKSQEAAVSEGLSHRAARLRRALERLTASERDGLIRGLEVLTEELGSRSQLKAEAERASDLTRSGCARALS
jgi:DNA-binding MarR family transcriptional regulator